MHNETEENNGHIGGGGSDSGAPPPDKTDVPPARGRDDGDEKQKQSSLLIDLAGGVELFHNADRDAFASVPVNGHRENYPLLSKHFRLWLTRQFYEAYHKTPGDQAIKEALAALAGRAIFEGPELAPAVRLAEHNGAIYLDLADDQWRAVKIARDGWQVVSDPPVKFLRPRGMKPLPVPQRGGSINELRQFINVADEFTWTLIKGWMLGALHPKNKYSILAINGEQGSAKSTTCEMIRATIDPNHSALRTLSSERDLMISATNGWIIAFDNLSGIPGHVSDALCRLATGGGFSTRVLYSDDDEKLFNATRPILFNGIEELGSRPDLIDRMTVVQLQAIPPERRKPVKKLWADFDNARPRILGALLDAVSAALRNLPTVKLPSLPRMADFAEWVTAGEVALGIKPGGFMAAYMQNRSAANNLAIEASSVGPAIVALMENKEDWTGTAKELLHKLADSYADDMTRRRPDWPSNPKSLSDKLRRLVPVLRQAGIGVSFLGRSKHGTLIRLEREGEQKGERPSFATPSAPDCGPGDAGDANDGRKAGHSLDGEGVMEV